MTEPMMKGRFTLYETADGGYHVAYLADGESEPKHLPIPAKAVRLAKAAAEGGLSPMQVFKELMSLWTGDRIRM